MKKPLAVVLLVVLGSFLTLCVGVAEAVFVVLAADGYRTAIMAAVALILLTAHTVGSAFAYRHFSRKHGLSAGKFVLLNALPALIVSAVEFLVFFAMCGFSIYADYEEMVAPTAAFGEGVYAVVYAGVLFPIARAVGKRKERL